MRTPIWATKQGNNEAEKNQRAELISYLKKISELKNELGDSLTYKAELLDFGRVALHSIVRLDLQEAIGIAKNSKGTEKDKKDFETAAEKATGSLTVLGDLLATDKKFCLSDTLYRMLNEPGVNRQIRMVVLEHASGILFDNYALNDSAEFIRLVSVPLLKSFLEGMRMTVNDPVKYPFGTHKKMEFIDGVAILKKDGGVDVEITEEESTGLDKRHLELKNNFTELPALPFDVVKNKKHPSNIINDWILNRKE